MIHAGVPIKFKSNQIICQIRSVIMPQNNLPESEESFSKSMSLQLVSGHKMTNLERFSLMCFWVIISLLQKKRKDTFV